jgi:hypothetical protein
MGELCRLRQLLHLIAAQTDPAWGRQLARLEVGAADKAKWRTRFNGSVLDMTLQVISDRPAGVAKGELQFLVSMMLGRIVSMNDVGAALETLKERKHIRIWRKLYFPFAPRPRLSRSEGLRQESSHR